MTNTSSKKEELTDHIRSKLTHIFGDDPCIDVAVASMMSATNHALTQTLKEVEEESTIYKTNAYNQYGVLYEIVVTNAIPLSAIDDKIRELEESPQ